jgi:hypothetical protein
MTRFFSAERFLGWLSQIVVHDFAETESKVGADVSSFVQIALRRHLELRDVGEAVTVQFSIADMPEPDTIHGRLFLVDRSGRLSR